MAFPKVVSRILERNTPQKQPEPISYTRPKIVKVNALPWIEPSEPKSCPEGKCLIGGPMTANAIHRVKDAVERIATTIEKTADETSDRLNRLSDEAKDKIYRVERSVADPLESALKSLDELLGGNGGPPLE